MKQPSDGDGDLISPVTTFAYDEAGNLIDTYDAVSQRSSPDQILFLILYG